MKANEKDIKKLVRTFVAILLPDKIKLELAALLSDLHNNFPWIRWVPYENVHLTLKFLGGISADDVNNVYSGCRKVVREVEPFIFSFKGLGVFPSVRSPRIIWLGVEMGKEELAGLATKIESSLEEKGFAREKRKFQSHFTLGRIRIASSGDIPEKDLWNELMPYHNFRLGEVMVDKICVMKSMLHPKGAEYHIMNEFKLGTR